jgi:hypothetical protein
MPLLQKKVETIEQSKQSGGSLLFIKIDNHASVVISPYSADRDPNLHFPNGQIVKSVWLTEPATRMHIPVPLVVTVYFWGGFAIALLMVLLIRWSWYFLLSRLRELSQAIQGR